MSARWVIRAIEVDVDVACDDDWRRQGCQVGQQFRELPEKLLCNVLRARSIDDECNAADATTVMSLMMLRVTSLPLLELDFSICTMFIIPPGSVFVTNILIRNDPTKKSEISSDTEGIFLAKFGPTLTKKLLNLSTITLASVTTLLSI